jgi:hypothetical protein
MIDIVIHKSTLKSKVKVKYNIYEIILKKLKTSSRATFLHVNRLFLRRYEQVAFFQVFINIGFLFVYGKFACTKVSVYWRGKR